VNAPTDFEGLLRTLLGGMVEFILVGGLAATVHGSARSTFDVDVVYRRTSENIAHLVEALKPLAPYLRGAPSGLPFRFDAATLLRGLNFMLQTTLGDLDLLGEIAGGGTYGDLYPTSQQLDLFGFECRCVSLETLIRLKRAAGRPKDLEVLAELESLLDRQRTDAGR
jgi:predicted nucleotidyltransferase